MRSTFAAAALVGLAAANPLPAGGAPSAPAPAGCSPNYNGQFEIEVVNVTSSSKKRDTVLTLTLKDGVLTDEDGRQGYIASNYQFQFNTPIQVNAQYTSGFSACSNGSLALGGSAVFYQCLSGTFYNLYDESTGAQCSPVTIDIINGASASGSGSTTVVSQQSDGQPTETPVSSPVCEYTDGQPQETACPVTQISDGQIQATTGVPVTQISDGQIQATTAATPVTQISDGQIQATTAAPVSQISDGQVQATTGTPVTQISDGQVQATTGTPVTQISDGQVQATTGTPVTQISDGQIQATTGTPVTQISDGQIQATTAATSAPYVAGAGKVEGGLFGLAAALLAAVAL